MWKENLGIFDALVWSVMTYGDRNLRMERRKERERVREKRERGGDRGREKVSELRRI